MRVSNMTRRERRAQRRRWSVTAREARLAARLARLDYKTSGETGAMRVPTKTRTWHLNNRANGHRPLPGQRWDRSGPTYVVAVLDSDSREVRVAKPIISHRWRRLTARTATDDITE